MNRNPLRTTVIGSYPFPSWLLYASENLAAFGEADIAEMQDVFSQASNAAELQELMQAQYERLVAGSHVWPAANTQP